MFAFFGNSAEMHVKLDIKAIAITKHKSSFKESNLIILYFLFENLFYKVVIDL